MPEFRATYLFDSDGRDCLLDLEKQLTNQIGRESDDALLRYDIDWYVSALVAGLRVAPIEFSDPTRDTPQEVEVEVYPGFDYGRRGDEPAEVPGLLHTIRYPVYGYTPLLQRCPSTWYSSRPVGRVEGSDVIFEYALPGYDHGGKLRDEHNRNFDLVLKYVANANNDLGNFLAQLPTKLKVEVERRQRNILSKRSSGDSLGIPISSPGMPQRTVGKTVEEYRSVIQRPGTRDQNDPVPSVEFDGILGIVEHAGRQCELFPKNTVGWGENEFRNNIIGYLNLPYAGQATGETFIRAGKADILIRDQGHEIFVAECKMWSGKAKIQEDLSQLFNRYLTWRATKAAMIYFNTGKNTTEVVAKLRQEAMAHSCFVSPCSDKHATHLRLKFRHPSDPKRVFDFAILVFAVLP